MHYDIDDQMYVEMGPHCKKDALIHGKLDVNGCACRPWYATLGKLEHVLRGHAVTYQARPRMFQKVTETTATT